MLGYPRFMMGRFGKWWSEEKRREEKRREEKRREAWCHLAVLALYRSGMASLRYGYLLFVHFRPFSLVANPNTPTQGNALGNMHASCAYLHVCLVSCQDTS